MLDETQGGAEPPSSPERDLTVTPGAATSGAAPRRRGLTNERPWNPKAGLYIVMTMLAIVVIPAAITLHTVRVPATIQVSSSNPTPYGYTVSLLLFIIPMVVIACWLVPSESLKIPRRAFWVSIAILSAFGIGLDFFFAHLFLQFNNPGATLGIPAPALVHWVPVEEYIFYVTGFVVVLLFYIWLGEFWLAAYNVADYPGEARKVSRLLQFHPSSLLLGSILIVAAVIYKKLLSGSPDGFPGYFTYLAVIGIVPAVGFYPAVRNFINWRALSFTLFIIVLISLFWEATLAVPYQWWGYQETQMMGLAIGAWSRLPIEAVCVWIAVTFATVIVFEVVKLWQSSGRPAREAFFGRVGE